MTQVNTIRVVIAEDNPQNALIQQTYSPLPFFTTPSRIIIILTLHESTNIETCLFFYLSTNNHYFNPSTKNQHIIKSCRPK